MFVLSSKKKDKNKEEKFFLELLDFYKEYISMTAESVKKLSELQKNYSNKYADFVEFQKDPSSIMDIAKDIDSDRGAILFFLFAKIAMIQSKMMHVYDLDAEQQKQLSNDLSGFIKDVDDSLEKLKRLKETKNVN